MFESPTQHLGFGQKSELPTGRGFDTYLGYWNGAESYSAHTAGNAYDFARDTATALEYAGRYSTDVFTQRAVDIITGHARAHKRAGINADTEASAPTVPLFLYLVSEGTRARERELEQESLWMLVTPSADAHCMHSCS